MSFPSTVETSASDSPQNGPFYRVYKSSFFTPMLFAALALCALSALFFMSWDAEKQSIKVLTIFSSISGLLLIIRSIRRIYRVELHADSVLFKSLISRVELRYNRVERLHFDRERLRLRIEKKEGGFIRVNRLKSDMKKMVFHLEAAVYGQTR